MAHSQVSVLPPYDQRAGQRGQQRRRTRPPSEDRATGPGLPRACGESPASLGRTPRPRAQRLHFRTHLLRAVGRGPLPFRASVCSSVK